MFTYADATDRCSVRHNVWLDYHEASKDANSIPRCNIGLNLNVSGNGTLAKQNTLQ